VITPVHALEALRAQPCGERAVAVLAERDDAWLVGGIVRDALLGRAGGDMDVDVVVEGDPEPVARALGRVVEAHARFGTFVVEADGGCRYDVVWARRETYARPGALPDVERSSLEDDLARRDFTINAVALSGRGDLRAVDGALDDLAARRLRVLHDASFRDDPTRLWRLVRYAVRLGFVPEPETDRLATEAVAAGALETVSGDRLGAELRLALGEPRPLSVLHAAQNLRLVEGLTLDPAVVSDALALLAPEGSPALTVLGAVIPDAAWPRPYGFTAAELHVLERCAEVAPLEPARPSEVAARLRGEPVEAVAVAGARGDAATARRWLADWRHVALEIDGRDLLAAGVPQGPELGRRLARVLALRLDGELPAGRDAELRAALKDGA
jgi:tRNA nucleotidyltransferase (CCA-adding enzyme)